MLVVALIGVWSFCADADWGGKPESPSTPDPEGALVFLGRLLPPLGIIVGVHLVWTGANEPGGAFQGGTILAAMWILVMIAGLSRRALDQPPLAAVRARRRTRAVSRDRRRRLRNRGSLSRLSGGLREAAHSPHRSGADPLDRRRAGIVGARRAGEETATMNSVTLAGLGGCALIGLGLYGLVTHPHLLRKIVAFNVMGGGVFLLFGGDCAPRRGRRRRRRSRSAGFGHHRDRRRLLRHGARRRASPCASSGKLAVPSSADRSPRRPFRRERRLDACGYTCQRRDESLLLPAIIILPVAALLLAFLLGGRRTVWTAILVTPLADRARGRGRVRSSGAMIGRSSMSLADGRRRSASRCAPTASRRPCW